MKESSKSKVTEFLRESNAIEASTMIIHCCRHGMRGKGLSLLSLWQMCGWTGDGGSPTSHELSLFIQNYSGV